MNNKKDPVVIHGEIPESTKRTDDNRHPEFVDDAVDDSCCEIIYNDINSYKKHDTYHNDDLLRD
ncbi:MAG: hypothetical protein WC799_00495 [Desulfobacteraceae bacterium]|jgi:hypothetical protein